MTNSCVICTGQASRDYYGPCVDYQTLLGGGLKHSPVFLYLKIKFEPLVLPW